MAEGNEKIEISRSEIHISDSISYLKASVNPLSADVGIVRGNHNIYLFDLGNSKDSLQEIKSLSGTSEEISVILSHFHPDHIGNLKHVQDTEQISDVDIQESGKAGHSGNKAETFKLAEIYVGANTFGYTHCGQIVREDRYIDDGVKLHIFPLPSSHAKGCLGLEVNGEYAFLGDATYSTKEDGKIVYNATLLAEEIKTLEKLDAAYFLLSHQEKFVQKKENVLRQLHKIYERRIKGEPYIVLYQ